MVWFSVMNQVSPKAAFLSLLIVFNSATIGVMIMPLSTKNDRVLTIREAAEYLSYSEHTVRMYIRRGLINAGKFGPAVTILQSECDRFSKEKRPPGRPSEKN